MEISFLGKAELLENWKGKPEERTCLNHFVSGEKKKSESVGFHTLSLERHTSRGV